MKPSSPILTAGLIALWLAACSQPLTTFGTSTQSPASASGASISVYHPEPRLDDFMPTPDTDHQPPTIERSEQSYTVTTGDTLGLIAASFGVSAEAITERNDLENPNLLSVGQQLLIPPPVLGQPAPAVKLIPDAELVYSAHNAYFDLAAFIESYGGQLAIYHEEVEGETMTGPQIVQFVARNYSVNPRLLVALLEYQSSWLSGTPARLDDLAYPMGYADPNYGGLYKQLAWAADRLNRGFYLWQIDGLGFYTSLDGVLIPAEASLNAGTVGLHTVLAALYPETEWHTVVGTDGIIQTYRSLFGNPWDWDIEALSDGILSPPAMQLPIEPGVGWYFTGGPHGGYGNGSAWAAIDFAPPADVLGCVQSSAWVTAVADGVIVRSEHGAVLQDLDGDGNPGTGWVILYMHVENRERVNVGDTILAGEHIGHPSCEGGVSTGTHLHIARLYNGMWVSADGAVPFILSGWSVVGTGIQYDGELRNSANVIPACECQDPTNTVTR